MGKNKKTHSRKIRDIRANIIASLILILTSIIIGEGILSLYNTINRLTDRWDNDTKLVFMQIVIISITIMIMMFGTLLMYIMKRTENLRDKDKYNIEKKELIRKIEVLNDKVNEHRMFIVDDDCWDIKVFSKLIDKLINRRIYPFTIVKIQCTSDKSKKTLRLRRQFIVEDKVMQFELDDNHYLLVFIQIDYIDTKDILSYIITDDIVVEKMFEADGLVDNTDAICKRFGIKQGKVNNNETI